MTNTLGGNYHCENCGHAMNDLVYRPTIINARTYIKQEPRIDDKGIWVPCSEYVPEGTESNYKLLISKEMFIEAYHKWIKGEER